MMDVDMVQRVGKLAQELLQHGMASDKEEALRLADSYLNKKKDLSDIQRQIAGKPAQEPQESHTVSMSSSASTVPPFLQQEQSTELKLQLSKTTTQLEKHRLAIVELQEQMKLMADEIGRLKTAPQKTYLEKEKEKPQTTLKTEETKQNPRVGGWQPGDISIEKYFYSGPPK
ncbi:hypothetical protein HYS47_01105 [Candidatus Woesearchaeota archaeon]|nr:hypothetical protein [Candidatus Woesearchaeota archaeon]